MKNKNTFFDKSTTVICIISIVIIIISGSIFLFMEHLNKSTITRYHGHQTTEKLIDDIFSTEGTSPQQYNPELFGLININTAPKEELTLLPDIGSTKADSIIEYRSKNPFKKTSDITKVKGIGNKTFKKIKDYICID